MSVTSAPASVAPSMNAAASGSDDGRMSWPTTTLLRAGEVRERVADAARERLVDLVGIDARECRRP